ncbi:MAG: S8 family peptidase [Lachnospiraceae bacterium]
MYRVRTQIHWEEALLQNITGRGVTAAVLDTGIAPHPDFDHRVLAFKDFMNGQRDLYDDASHGTHVCGILAGSGVASQGRYGGIAPNVNLVVGKILDSHGDGDVDTMQAGIDWVVENRERYHIRVLNISIGSIQQNSLSIEERLLDKIEEAWQAGIVVVTAAGNQGPRPMSISPVGVSGRVLTVGCHEGGYFDASKTNLCERYSGRGPSRYAMNKPDLVAPGTDIMSCNANFGKTWYGQEHAYMKKSGTSMSTPIVSGACALAIQKYPYASNDEIKKRILYSSVDMHIDWNQQGWGMVDIKRLLTEKD